MPTITTSKALVPRRNSMRLSSQNLVACVGFALMAAAGTFFAFPSKCLKPLTILTSSVTTEATLDDRYQERTSTRKGITTTAYNVNYTFTVDGKTYRGSSAIDNEPTKTMTVTYVSGQPSINGLDLKTHAWIDLAIFLVPLGVLLASVLALVVHFRSRELEPSVASSRESTSRARR
jgi:hypothetical protein